MNTSIKSSPFFSFFGGVRIFSLLFLLFASVSLIGQAAITKPVSTPTTDPEEIFTYTFSFTCPSTASCQIKSFEAFCTANINLLSTGKIK